MTTEEFIERRRAQTLAPVTAEKRRSLIKLEAQRRIYAIAPQWKQANLTARGLELMPAKIARTLSESEAAEVTFIEDVWARIKAIREFSNWLEQQPPDTPIATAAWPS